MISKSESGGNWQYTWDFENRLTEAAYGAINVQYEYDALGRRIKRSGTMLETTKFTYDGLDVVMDDDSVSGVTKYQNGPGIDNKLKLANAGNAKYFLQDHLGSTVALTDPVGSVTEQTGYDSFGNATNGAFSTRYQFTGREHDQFTGLHYYRARWYDANLGRFISEDPIGLAGGINPFAYVLNNPLAGTDSLGLDAEWDQQVWRAQQDLIEAAAPAIEFGIGFGDTALFGGSKWIRQWQGIDDPNLECSVAYQAGGWTATAVEIATGVGGLSKLGMKFFAKNALKHPPFTKSSLARGREMHKAYKAGMDDGINTFKEFTGIRGIRPDFVDFGTKTIYELKPFNPRGIKSGLAQLEKYRSQFEGVYGGVWNTVLDLY